MASIIRMFNVATQHFTEKFFESDYWRKDCETYAAYWRETSLPAHKGCGICGKVMSTNDTVILENMTLITEIFSRFPVTPMTIVIGWYEVKRVLKIKDPAEVSPLDILSHMFYRVCPDLLRTGTVSGKEVVKALKICMEYSLIEEEDEGDNDSDTDDDMTGEIKIPRSQTLSKTHFLKAFVKKFLRKGKSGSCSTNPRSDCIYGNAGDLTQIVQGRNLLVDGRALISMEWFKKNRGELFTFEDFLKDDNYGAGQPGVKKIDYDRGREQIIAKLNNSKAKVMRMLGFKVAELEAKRQKESMVCEAHTITNEIERDGMKELNSFEDEIENICDPETQTFEERNEQIREYQKDIYENLSRRLRNLNSLHTLVNSYKSGGVWKELFEILNPCLWCDTCLLPEMRMVLADLTLLSRASAVRLGTAMTMGGQVGSALLPSRGEPNKRLLRSNMHRKGGVQNTNSVRKFHLQKGAHANANLAVKATPKQILEWLAEGVGVYGDDMLVSATAMDIDPTDESYSFCFDGPTVSSSAVKTVVKNWLEKYPFLEKSLNVDNEDLTNHTSSLAQVSCAMNARASACETDHFNTVKFRCLMPVIEIALKMVIRTNKKKDHSTLLGAFNDFLFYHGMLQVMDYEKIYRAK